MDHLAAVIVYCFVVSNKAVCEKSASNALTLPRPSSS